MIQFWTHFINEILGLDASTLNLWQMGARAIVVYSVGLVLVRTAGDRRFIGKYAAFDVILSIILGSTLSRTINGSAPFFPSLVAAFVLVAMHWLVAGISFRLTKFETLIKGNPRVLIQDGQLCQSNMAESHITAQDLEAVLRLTAQLGHPSQVEQARIENSGDISILPKHQPPKIIEVEVESGVQTVRIQLQ